MDSILLVNDETTKTENISSALSTLPYEIHIATNNNAGIQLFRKYKPFLIVIDVNEEYNQGFELVQTLINSELQNGKYMCHFSAPQINPELKTLSIMNTNIYVIVLAMNLPRNMIQQFRSLGVDYILNKPIHLYTLQGIINNIHRLKTTRDELCQKFGSAKID
jgi:CheY-like chemotaxis protein